MKSLPVTALRFGGLLTPTSSMQVNLGSLKCTGKVGIYPSDVELEEKRALEKRLNVLNETLIEHMKTTTTTTTTTTELSPYESYNAYESYNSGYAA